MKKINAYAYIENRNNKQQFKITSIEVYTINEATQMLNGRNWIVGKQAYDIIDKTNAIAWFADCGNGEGIWVEQLY